MNILFITQYFAPEIGAAPVRLTALADALQVAGHEVSVVTSLPNYPTGKTFSEYRRRILTREQRPSGVRVHRIWTVPAIGAGMRRYINYLSFIATAPMLMRRISRPDAILVESPPLTTTVIGSMYAKRFRAPIILNIADLWPDAVIGLGLAEESSLQVRFARKLEAWSYRQAALLSHATRGIGDELKARGIPPDRLVFLPNGADTSCFSPRPRNDRLAAELGLSDKRVLLYAGTHSVAAGMEVLIDTAEVLRDDESIVILLVGDGPAKASLVTQASERGLTNLVFMDPVQPEQIADLYSISAAGLVTLADNPMFTGTRPAKMFPALACRKPVVYSGHGEGADLIERYTMGVVVPPGDANALASAIRRIVGAPVPCDSMGENGRSFVEDHLSWDTIAADWVNAIRARLR